MGKNIFPEKVMKNLRKRLKPLNVSVCFTLHFDKKTNMKF